jgi:site-specific DNA recombinase
VVAWQREEFAGEHPALVSVEIWERVQEVLRQHANAEIRVRIDPHYLRGSLFCDQCGSRISDHYAKRRAHRYFFCLGGHRRRTEYDEPYTPTHLIEPEVEERWGEVHLAENPQA